MNSNYDKNQPIEAPFAPDLTRVVDELMSKMAKPKDNHNDNLTSSQDVLTTLSSAETASLRSTILQSMVYIKRTKQVINALHEHIELLTQLKINQRNLLKHCLTQLENPKPRNQELIINAIKQHLGEK